MTACDNEDCDIVLFHYACVNEYEEETKRKMVCSDSEKMH